jgi:hypothetical protein
MIGFIDSIRACFFLKRAMTPPLFRVTCNDGLTPPDHQNRSAS